MARPRTNDPSNLPERPTFAKTPEREAELIDEMKRRIAYIGQNYRIMGRYFDSGNAYNESLNRLKRAVRRKRRAKPFQHRCHPDIELAINHRARRYARRRGSKVSQKDVNAAARWAASHLRARRGRPSNRNLRFHLTGVIAVIQEFSGQPVLAETEPGGVYDPQFAEGISRCVPIIFDRIDPDVTLTTLVDHAIEIRKAWAGRQLRFFDLFPLYGAEPGPDGIPQLRSGYRLEHFEPNIPIYSP